MKKIFLLIVIILNFVNCSGVEKEMAVSTKQGVEVNVKNLLEHVYHLAAGIKVKYRLNGHLDAILLGVKDSAGVPQGMYLEYKVPVSRIFPSGSASFLLPREKIEAMLKYSPNQEYIKSVIPLKNGEFCVTLHNGMKYEYYSKEDTILHVDECDKSIKEASAGIIIGIGLKDSRFALSRDDGTVAIYALSNDPTKDLRYVQQVLKSPYKGLADLKQVDNKLYAYYRDGTMEWDLHPDGQNKNSDDENVYGDDKDIYS